MITDKNLRVSTDQTLKLNGTSAVSDSSIDLSVARDIGEGKGLFFNFALTTAVSAGTSVEFKVVIDDNEDLSTATTIASSGAILKASLVKGKNIVVPIPPAIGSLGKRYLGATYTVVGDNSAGAGAVTADIVETIQDGKKFYASGFSVK